MNNLLNYLPNKKLIIASHNQGKVQEIKELLMPMNLQICTAQDFNLSEPEETGTTFVENSQLKAKEVASKSQLPALADDSGLVIPALNGDPGVYSARWAEVIDGRRDFKSAIDKIGRLLNFRSGVPASMVCVLSLALPNSVCHSFYGEVFGTLQFKEHGSKGFGYDPIFQPDGYTDTFGEMDSTLKHSISHRFQAFSLFLKFIQA